jgi:hypothetical protein
MQKGAYVEKGKGTVAGNIGRAVLVLLARKLSAQGSQKSPLGGEACIESLDWISRLLLGTQRMKRMPG